MMKKTVFALLAAVVFQFSWAEGDVGAGKDVFDNNCVDCHYEDDFSGYTAAEILESMEEMSAPDAMHEFDLTQLSEEEKANIAAYYASVE